MRGYTFTVHICNLIQCHQSVTYHLVEIMMIHDLLDVVELLECDRELIRFHHGFHRLFHHNVAIKVLFSRNISNGMDIMAITDRIEMNRITMFVILVIQIFVIQIVVIQIVVIHVIECLDIDILVSIRLCIMHLIPWRIHGDSRSVRVHRVLITVIITKSMNTVDIMNENTNELVNVVMNVGMITVHMVLNIEITADINHNIATLEDPLCFEKQTVYRIKQSLNVHRLWWMAGTEGVYEVEGSAHLQEWTRWKDQEEW